MTLESGSEINIYEELTPEQSLREFTETVEIYKELLNDEPVKLLQSVQNEMIQVLTAQPDTDRTPQEKDTFANTLLAGARLLFENLENHQYSWENLKSGMLTETYVRIALKRLQFRIHEPTINDDTLGGIDLIASTGRIEEPIMLIQIKSAADLSKIVVENYSDPGNNSVKEADLVLSEEKAVISKSIIKKMSARIASHDFAEEHPDLLGRDIVCLTFWIPSGKNDILSPYKRTGEPVKDYPVELLDPLEKALSWTNKENDK